LGQALLENEPIDGLAIVAIEPHLIAQTASFASGGIRAGRITQGDRRPCRWDSTTKRLD
jgi:hypothetical protein